MHANNGHTVNLGRLRLLDVWTKGNCLFGLAKRALLKLPYSNCGLFCVHSLGCL